MKFKRSFVKHASQVVLDIQNLTNQLITDPTTTPNWKFDQLAVVTSKEKVKKYNTETKEWEDIQITHGQVPQIKLHQLFVQGVNLFMMGGSISGQSTANCFKVHLLTGEIEKVASMD